MGKIMEAIFCVAYLCVTTFLGIRIVRKSKGAREGLLFGIMTLVLVSGDAFHLVPRILSAVNPAGDYSAAMGIGTLITSITMTFFYLIMYSIFEIRNGKGSTVLKLSMIVLALIRIVLSLMPQNDWTGESPVSWGIYRNIPFVIMGIIMIVLFFKSSNDRPYRYMWLAILLSFSFYLPVVLWADVSPMIGMLMLPKTCMYVWMVVMGYKEYVKVNAFDIQEYMTKGVERVVADAIKATLSNPKESSFMLKFAAASKLAGEKRKRAEKDGEHRPPFLIASITSKCNLHCAGCYSRCNHATVDEEPVKQLTSEEWLKIFDEADDLGISFILLAGGEPMIRRDIIEAAGKKQNILFPIFTNGTYMDERYFELLDSSRNLIPIMSIEGEKEITDSRRGAGIYEKLIANMDELCRRGLIFGASITVTTQNISEVTSDSFLKKLSDRGCKAVIFVEFVPVTDDSNELAPGDKEREYLSGEIKRLREKHPEMVYISFPGDEKSSGGCVAAGRGFFHINSHGGAEPCPFSPYSDINVRDTSLRDAMNSRLFRELRDRGYLLEDHPGGCTLYERREDVERIVATAAE